MNVRKCWSSYYQIYDSTTHNSIYQYSYEMDIQIYRGSTAQYQIGIIMFQMEMGLTRMLFTLYIIGMYYSTVMNNSFSLIRLGRKWMCGQILYTFLANVFFYYSCYYRNSVFSTCWFSSNWEAIIVTLSKSECGKTGWDYSGSITSIYSPVSFLLTYSLNILIGYD